MTALTRTDPVGLIGLGNLGQPMALNLLERGWTLRVADAKSERVDPVVEAGATIARAEDLAECPVICFVVPDEKAIRAVLSSGLQDRLTADHILVVHSTTLPERAKELAASVAAAVGTRYLEVPVSGGSERARNGELTAFVGGDEADVDRIRPLLQDEAGQIFTLGGIGTASVTKLANQLIAFSALAGVHEALRLTASYGVDDEQVLAAIATATGDTWVGRNFAFWDRTALDYNRAGVPLTDRPWSKDLVEVLDTARDHDLDLPLAALLSKVLPPAVEEHAKAYAARAGA
jgi:3-hydroxyisobutyrate dehydrogenase-like beta-hydroxyacid dehydrogenase